LTVRLAITTGEPAGIGPELCLSLAQRPVAARCVLIGNHDLLQQRARDCGIRVDLTAYQAHRPAPPVGTLEVIDVPLAAPVLAGRLDPRNSRAVLQSLDIAIDGCRDGQFDAMVTAPLHKSVICEAGTPFTGHTEYLQARCGVDQVVMLLEGGGMRVALATTHLPLREVADAITPASLERTLRILHHDLARMYRIASPRILVAGLNPHAGEAGHLGREEIDTIIPVLERLRGEGLQLSGPLPADTLFVQHHLDEADAVLAMYHDQGLPVLKHASFGGGVNVTLGLPIIRTSVDHGTALDLAGTGRADSGSLHAAASLAIRLINNGVDNRVDAKSHATV